MMNRLRPTPRNPELQIGNISGRSRINLAPGHSLMDWIRLGRDKGDLSGVGAKKKGEVTEEELAKHNSETDLWMAIKGKVYNITPYLDFHPGGVEELMRAAGADGTQLFEEIHSWVNVESMLSKCFVGTLIVADKTIGAKLDKPRMSIATFQPPPVLSSIHPTPTYDWSQNSNELKVVIYTNYPKIEDNRVVVDVGQQEVIIEVRIAECIYFVHFKPTEKLEETCKVTTVKEKVEIAFKKKTEKMWPSLGTTLKLNKVFIKASFAETRFWHWTVISNTAVTHDTRLIALKSPPGTRMVVPVGFHFIIHHVVQGMELARSYTVALPSLIKDENSPNNTKQSVMDKDSLVYLMIKKYVGGALSPWITSIKPGEKVKLNRFEGTFDVNSLNDITHLIMFAAGTGFTAMIRPIDHVLFKMPQADLKVTLVFYNKTVQDILWHDQLDQLAKTKNNFTVNYSLSSVNPDGWTGLTGRVTSDHVKRFVPKPSDTVQPLLLICGQYAFNDMVESFAKAHGLCDEHIHIFSSFS